MNNTRFLMVLGLFTLIITVTVWLAFYLVVNQDTAFYITLFYICFIEATGCTYFLLLFSPTIRAQVSNALWSSIGTLYMMYVIAALCFIVGMYAFKAVNKYYYAGLVVLAVVFAILLIFIFIANTINKSNNGGKQYE